MELKVEGELCLRGFSPHQVSYLPSLNCVLVSDGRGAFRCVDIASGKEHSLPEITVPDFSSHVLCDVDQTTSKLVVVCGNKLSARLAHAGALQLRTMLQTPVKSMQEEVTVELPLSACSTLLKELKAPHSGRRTASLKMVVSIERTLEEALAKSSNCDKFATVCFSGPLGQLSSLFEELSKSLLTGDKSPGHPATPLLFALTLKLHLLDPENGPAMMGFERGDALSSNEARLMNIEAMRRLSLAGWPHLNYQWAVPKVMAKAGFYQTTSINHGGTAAGDRVTCFCCRVYLYSWEPTDEPWSEHERHAFQCRFVRGEYTANVPLAITESSHPASEYTHDRDTVCCMSTSIGTGLVALGTEQGRIAVWDLDRGLFIIEHAHLDLTEDHVSMYLDMAVPLTSDSSPSSSHSQDEDATFQQATVPLLVDTPAPPDPLPEHIKDVEQSSIINKDPNTNKISAAVETEGTPSSMPTIELTPDTKDTVLVNPSLQPSSPTDTDSTDISSEQTIEEDVKMKFSEDPETEPVSKKRRFHVTALSVVSVEKHVLSTSTPEICTAVLITGVTIFRDNKCVAMLMLHKVCSKIRKKRKSQKPPSTYISPIAIDLDPEYIPLMDHPSMQPPVYSNQSWEAPSKAGTDDPELPATLEYSQSFSLGNDIVPSDFEGLPQIRQIVPLDSGRLLAVSCTVSTSDSILKEDKSDSSTCTLFVISLSQNGHITASSFCVIPVDEPVVCIRALSDNSETHSEDSNNPILLAVLFGSGRVVVYDVSLPLPVATYQCSNCEDPTSRMVDCTYCPATCQLAVTTSNGKLWMLGLDKGSDETKQIKMEDLKQDLQTRSLTPSELDQLSVLTESSPEGIEFTGSTPQDWRQISLHQYHRGSPSHLFNGGRGKAVTGNKKAWQTGRVWLYQPPSGISSRTKCRYKFKLSPVPHSEYPISSIAITLNIASSQCLKETASLSLLRPKWTTPTSTDPSECDTLLGPIKIKSLVDITGKSLTVVLSHPLLAVTAPPILWLLFEDLFAPNYNKVSFSAEPLTDTTATRGAWRTKAFRHYVKQPPNDQTKSKFVSVQATLSVTLHKSSRPLADLGPLMSPKLLPLLVCDPLFMTKLAIIACGGVVKEGERPLEAADLLNKRHAGESAEREITSTDIQEECRGVTNTLNNSSRLSNPQTETEDLLDDDGRKKQFQEHILGSKVVKDLQFRPVKVMIVEREAPNQTVHISISKTVKFKGDNKKTSKTDLLNERNNEGTTKVQLKQQIISCKEQLDNNRELKTTDVKQNEPSTKSGDPPENVENFPIESGGPPTDSECQPTEPIDLPADLPTEPFDPLVGLPTKPIDPPAAGTNSATNDNLSESSGNANDDPAETEHLNEPTISHDPPSTQGSSVGASCPNEQGNSSDPSSEQDTSTTDTPSYPSTTTSKTDKPSDITSDQTEDPQTPQTSHDLPSKDSTAKAKDSPRNQNHRKKRTKTKHQTPSQAPRKRCRSRNKRDAIKNRNQKKNEGKNPFPTQLHNEDVTRRPHDTDKQLVHQQKLDLGNTQAASRKKKSRRRHKRRLTPTQGEEESWPNSDDSESKRDADGHESTGSEVKFKRPNDTKRHRTRAPQCGDGSGALRDPEQSTNSSSDSVSEDKSWTRPTQESDPFTSKSDMVYHRPRPPPTSEGQPNCYVPSHEPPRPEGMASCVEVFAEPLHDPTTGQLLPATSHCFQLVFPTPSACVPVSLQPPLLYRFVINVIRGMGSGISLRDAISGWVETREPNQLRRLIVALIRFVMLWGRGIRSLDALTVQGEGVVNVVESGLVGVVGSDWESEQLLLLASILEEFLSLWEIQSVAGHSSDITPLRLFVTWVGQFKSGRVRVVTTPLVDALHQLGERSLRQRSPFVVEDVSDDDKD